MHLAHLHPFDGTGSQRPGDAAQALRSAPLEPDVIPAGARWGAQTARNQRCFSVGDQAMPKELIRAMAHLKWAGALVNGDLGLLDATTSLAIADAARRVADGEFDGQFPLSVWQSGSCAHSHANLGEVIANLAAPALLQPAHQSKTLSLQEKVNLSQSTHDVVAASLNIACALQLKARLLPALLVLRKALAAKAAQMPNRPAWPEAAAPMPVPSWDECVARLSHCEQALNRTLPALQALDMSGHLTAPGQNTRAAFNAAVISRLATRLHLPLVSAAERSPLDKGHEAVVSLHTRLRLLALALATVARDIRLLNNGPRAGFNGQPDPAQGEALLMVCMQVVGHDTVIAMATNPDSVDHIACWPLIALNVLDSLRLLSDAMSGFTWHCVNVQSAEGPQRLTPEQSRPVAGSPWGLPISQSDVPRSATEFMQPEADYISLLDSSMLLDSLNPSPPGTSGEPRRS